jgi:hypothetical protein
MTSVKLDWSKAEVKESKLRVDLDGELTDEWKSRFETTVALLDHGEWGKVKLKKDGVRVSDVTAGSEERLRFFLESAVTEANATGEDDDEDEDEQRPDEDDASEEESENPEDAELTENFREFGSESSDSKSKSKSS